MTQLLSLNREQLEAMVSGAVRNVFQTMLSMSAIHERTSSIESNGAPAHCTPMVCDGQQLVVGNVGFVGQLTGMVYLYMNYNFALHVASSMLGMDEAEIEEDDMVNDVIGEITNMTVGYFKNQLDEMGYPCRLTIPSILRGSNFIVEPVRSSSRHVFYFTVGDNQLAFDLLMKPGE